MALWEKGSTNEVTIDGILSEVKLQEGTDNKGGPAIFGEYKIKTTNTIDGVDYTVEIPVRVYQSKTTKSGKSNPAYTTAETIMKDYVSLAAGGEENATAVRLTGSSTSLQENFFVSKTNGQMIYSPAIRASFANKISNSDINPGARFKCICVIGELKDELNKDGEETGRTILKGIIPQWGGKVDVLNFIISNKKVADHIRNNWEQGNTVLIGGYINFTSIVHETTVEGSFGEPMIDRSTRTVRELIITGGHDAPLTEEEGAYNNADIAEALTERQSRIEAAKDKASNAAPKKAPSFSGFGF